MKHFEYPQCLKGAIPIYLLYLTRKQNKEAETARRPCGHVFINVRASFQPKEPSWGVQCVFLGPIPLEGGRSPHLGTHQHLQSGRHGPLPCMQHR